VALAFVPSDAGLLALQAAVVAAPRPAPKIALFERLSGRGWALVPIGSILVVIFAIRYVSDTAQGLTYLALVAVPLLAAAALAWASRRSTRWAALLAIPLFVLAWADRTTLAGQIAAALLSALSCVTLGVLLAMVTPPGWLKLGIIAMAAADSWLVLSDLLQAPNNVLVLAHPGAGLPQLQNVAFGTAIMGYGDLFVAAVLGAVLARDRGLQLWGAGLTLVIAGLFDLLFFVLNELPATVPVALALIVIEVSGWVRRRRRARARGPAAEVSPGPRAASGVAGVGSPRPRVTRGST
jgi:hypothetical protein